MVAIPSSMPAECSAPRRIRVGGCPVDAIGFEEAVQELCRRIETRQRTHVVFINAAKIVEYHRNPELRQVIEAADLLLADGKPVVWASRLRRTSIPGRVNGTDLMERMLAEAAARGYGVYLLGATPEVIDRTVAEVGRRHPRLRICGHRNGYFTREQEREIVEQIDCSGADIVFVGMSTPLKELWGARHRAALGAPICQGVGGSFDVIAGLVRRAPRWMQSAGLEWLYRLLQEPRRLFWRYARTNAAFLVLVLKDVLRGRAPAAAH